MFARPSIFSDDSIKFALAFSEIQKIIIYPSKTHKLLIKT